MKNGWETKTLEDVCQFSNGLWKGEKPPFVNVGVIRNTNFTKEGTLDDSDIAYLDVESKKLEKRRLRFGDVILEKSGGGPKQPVGRVALFDKEDGDFSFSNFTAALRVLDPRELDFRFLHKFLHWTYLSGVTEGMQSHSTGIRNLDGDAYKAIKISFPSLSEQQRIIGILDKAFEGIATAKTNAEKSLQNARTLFESYLQSVFTQRGPGWAERKLGDESLLEIVDGDRGVNYPKASDFHNEGHCLFLNTKNVRPNGFDFETTMFVTAKKDGQLRKGKLKRDDVVLTTRGTIGNIGLYSEDVPFDHIRINSGMLIFRPNKRALLPSFLFELLRSEIVKGQIREQTTGAAQPQLPIKTLVNFTIPVPTSLNDQIALVKKLRAFEPETQRLVSIYQQKLDALEALKKSLLHQAFTGKL
jgi:type I restriction enzyme, S subunit